MISLLDDDVLRQYIDARMALLTLYDAISVAREFRGGMIWRTINKTDYLIKTNLSGQKSLGRRTDATETIYRDFCQHKQEAENRLNTLKQVVIKHERLNRALYVGRTPRIVIAILNMLAKHDLIQFLTVIGPCSVFAYESAAGVRIEQAREEADAKSRKTMQLQFISRLNPSQERSLSHLLQKVDPTFRVTGTDAGGFCLTNAKAFGIDLIRHNKSHLFSCSVDGDEFTPIPAQCTELLTSAKRIEIMVVDASGKMALLPTISPFGFYQFKLLMAQQNNRAAEKRLQDQFQATEMLDLMQRFLPQYLPSEQQNIECAYLGDNSQPVTPLS